MKILTNTNLNSAGGIAKRADEMARYSKEHDIPLVVISIAKDKPKIIRDGPVTTYHIRTGNDINRTREIYRGTNNLETFSKKLERVIKETENIIEIEKPDVVLSEGTFYAPWTLHTASKKLKLPTIVSYAGILTKEEANAPEPYRTLFKEIEHDFNREDDFYIFPSSLTKMEVEKIFERKINKSVVIPNGVSKEFFDESKRNGRNSKEIGFVGRAHPIKNIEFLVQLAKKIRESGKDYSISAVSHIRKDKPLRKELEENEIRLIPPNMNPSQLQNYFQTIGSVVCPSLFETYGNVPIEAVASGTPALISKNMGVVETFIDLNLENLILNNFASVEEVLQKISEISNNPIKRETREKIKKVLQWETIIQRYIGACEKVAA
jgi:glycosyltransferase involved in cell wall biosynthesis